MLLLLLIIQWEEGYHTKWQYWICCLVQKEFYQKQSAFYESSRPVHFILLCFIYYACTIANKTEAIFLVRLEQKKETRILDLLPGLENIVC